MIFSVARSSLNRLLTLFSLDKVISHISFPDFHMFKPFRIRTLSAISRRTPQYSSLRFVHHENGHKVQRVQFRRPPVSWRCECSNPTYGAYTDFPNFRRATSLLIYPVLFYVYLSVITPDELLEDEDEEDLEEEELDPMFIPLGWAKQTKRTFYKGSDPEWQEFVKFSKDHERHKRIRGLGSGKYARHK